MLLCCVSALGWVGGGWEERNGCGSSFERTFRQTTTPFFCSLLFLCIVGGTRFRKEPLLIDHLAGSKIFSAKEGHEFRTI